MGGGVRKKNRWERVKWKERERVAGVESGREE